MTITIQVDDKGTVTALPGSDNGVPGAATAAYGNDGGAPKVGNAAAAGNTFNSGSTTDIGGPPQWLSDALGGGGNTAPASAVPSGSGGSEDGGEAPSF